jgi:hypothetical protein
MKIIISRTILILLLAAPFAATAQPPFCDYEESTAAVAWPDGTVSLFMVPDGSGMPFTGAFELDGNGRQQDGTIEVRVRTLDLDPVEGMPAEDIWLFWQEGGPVVCGGQRLIADGPSSAEGRARFTHPLRAGGFSLVGPRVVVGGCTARGFELPIVMNSPDIDGDGRVNLTDTGFFAHDLLFGPYSYRSDFNADGVINLTDAGMIMENIGMHCP